MAAAFSGDAECQDRPVSAALRQYLGDLAASKQRSRRSVFWERQLENSGGDYGAVAEMQVTDLRELVRNGGYGFESLPRDVRTTAEDPRFQEARRAAKELRRRSRAAQVLAGCPGAEADFDHVDRDLLEHARALEFLRSVDLLGEYVACVSALRVRSTMSTARHWFYARRVQALLRERAKTVDVLEVGAGAGNLAVLLSTMMHIRSYTIVDLPEMLVHSAFTIDRILPDAALSFGSAPDVRDDAMSPAFSFLADHELELVSGLRYDVLLNFNSFMEMDREARDRYIAKMYRVARDGALFYNVNRRQRALPLRDGQTWDNNPLLYPYEPTDEVLVWDADPFQTATRARFNAAPTLAVTRAAAVRR